MTKIISEIKQDDLHKSGRRIGIKWQTNNDLLNVHLNLPTMWYKDFAFNTDYQEIQTEFTGQVSPIVQNAERRSQ